MTMKKASVSWAMGVIIALIGSIIFLAFIGLPMVLNMKGPVERLQLRNNCKTSVELHASFQTNSFKTDPSIIQCPTSFVNITSNKIGYIYGETYNDETLPGSEQLKERRIKELISDEIYYCWNQFGEGKKDLFGGPKKYCKICSLIQFEDNDIEVKGLYDFMMKTTVPDETLAKNGVTYFDYVNGYTKKGKYDTSTVNRQYLEQLEIDSKSPYAVVFVYAKSEPFVDNAVEHISKFFESAGGKTAIAAGVVALAGGIALSATGIGTPVGVVVVLAATATIARSVAFDGAIEGVIETQVKANRIKDWASFVVFGKYDESMLKGLGCEELPISD